MRFVALLGLAHEVEWAQSSVCVSNRGRLCRSLTDLPRASASSIPLMKLLGKGFGALKAAAPSALLSALLSTRVAKV